MALAHQVEELALLKCSLLPDEILEFILSRPEDYEAWTLVVDAPSKADLPHPHVSCPAHFTMKIRDIPIWFEIDFPNEYPLETTEFNITVRGYNLSRVEQQRWQDIISKKRGEMSQAVFPAYELISLQLLPLLHEEYDGRKLSGGIDLKPTAPLHPPSEPLTHALLTSHHLKSPHKRRSLQQWSSELHLFGFAKVGNPGLIYCSGFKSNVTEFVSRVRSMQWLALRIRFVDVLSETGVSPEQRPRWIEVEKIGEVVNEMRKLGRESSVLDLGIGSGGTK